MFFVYILKSEKTGKWYVGSTENPLKRLQEHNAGNTRSTKANRPYMLIYTEKFQTKSEALKREQLIKISGRIRKELKTKLSTAPSSNG
ncbi:MAG TPA: GIY-YIG nuclease family protein [Patescibacteria group bacterium]|nr:GIY-YIG nuclease family protein [Patescibacteria group bacterium]